MSKKTLNESIVRRFMGLANIQPTLSSNFIKENYGMEEEEEVQEEAMHSDEEKKEGMYAEEDEEMEEGMYGEEDEDPADAEAPPEEMDMPEPEEMDAGSPELEITKEEAAVLAAVLQKLTAAMPGEEAEAPMDAMDAPEGDEPEAELPPPGGEEGEEAPPEEEMLEQELSADDVVQEVARRVASRILKAKEAKQKMDKALGNDKK